MLIFDKSVKNRRSFTLPTLDVELVSLNLKRETSTNLVELSEIEVIRHYTKLSQETFAIDTGFYPLGSCTMKYNPKLNEVVASYEGFSQIHPLQELETVEGAKGVFNESNEILKELTGMDIMSFQPAAGAQGELASLLMIKAYHQDNHDDERTEMLVPDSAHGTNPASANMCGFKVVEVKSNEHGRVDFEDLKKKVSHKTAGLMLTNPNTLGLFETEIKEIADLVHDNGGLLYYDGANLNAIMGWIRPGDMGFDAIHLNLHKTFSTPHGGGGPGLGAIGVKNNLKKYMPVPYVENNEWILESESTIGPMKNFQGNFLVLVRALTYMKSLGLDGMKHSSSNAVLNANYMAHLIKDIFVPKYPERPMHEFVISLEELKKATGVSALDFSKGLIDYGVHPPTMYFPLVVKEALMIEPTETEPLESLELLSKALHELHDLAYSDADKFHQLPYTTKVSRLDEVKAARHPIVKASDERDNH